MKRFVQALDLKDDPGVVDAYVAHHARVWPDVEQSLRRIGIERMDIYLIGRRLVMVMDTGDGFDRGTAFAAHLADPKCLEWEALMQTFQQRVPGAREGEWWADMIQVYQLR
jgi:L-rhamnose mutarotase